MIKCPIILRIILVYHIATAYLPTFCIMIMAIIVLQIDEGHFEATYTHGGFDSHASHVSLL